MPWRGRTFLADYLRAGLFFIAAMSAAQRQPLPIGERAWRRATFV
jgi:hypothetical protein